MMTGPSKPRRFAIARHRDMTPRVRVTIAVGLVLAAVVTFAACGGCGRRASGRNDTIAAPVSGAASTLPPERSAVDAHSPRDDLLWSHAMGGDAEDLLTLAAHEGAVGLTEATSDPQLRPTAIRAMGYARGWCQLPFLAKTAMGKSDEEARVALEAIVELAARPLRAEDPEDMDELREGCKELGGLALDASRGRERRVMALRALRMMPCPPRHGKEDLPSDLDAR